MFHWSFFPCERTLYIYKSTVLTGLMHIHTTTWAQNTGNTEYRKICLYCIFLNSQNYCVGCIVLTKPSEQETNLPWGSHQPLAHMEKGGSYQGQQETKWKHNLCYRHFDVAQSFQNNSEQWGKTRTLVQSCVSQKIKSHLCQVSQN